MKFLSKPFFSFQIGRPLDQKKNHRLAISTYSDDKYENEISAEHPISLGEIIKAQISADDLPNYFEFYVGKGSK